MNPSVSQRSGEAVDIPNYFEGRLPSGFKSQYFEKYTCLITRAYSEVEVEKLFSLARLDRMLAAGEVPADLVEPMTRKGGAKPKIPKTASGAIDCIGLRRYLNAGNSFQIHYMERIDCAVKRFAETIERCFGCPVSSASYFTPAGAEGFAPHYDKMDVFVIQFSGRKTWKIYPDYANPVSLPTQQQKRGTHAPCEETAHQFELNVGDMLYIPRGVMHGAVCTDSHSAHISFGILSSPWADYLRQAVSNLEEKDSRFRRTAVTRSFAQTSPEAVDGDPKVAELIDQLVGFDPSLAERQLYRRSVAGWGVSSPAALEQGLAESPVANLAHRAFKLTLAERSVFRVFRNASGQWQLWTYGHEAGLEAEEASVLIELKEKGQLDGGTLRQRLGEDAAETLAQTAALIGIAKVDLG